MKVWHILTLSFVVGTAQSFGGPAYSALVPSPGRARGLANAIALNSIQFNLARVIGPVFGGLALKHAGSAWCFGLNALSFVAVIISLLSLDIDFKPPRTGESILTSMKQGFRFIRKQGAMETLDRDRLSDDGSGDPHDHVPAGVREECIPRRRDDFHRCSWWLRGWVP